MMPRTSDLETRIAEAAAEAVGQAMAEAELVFELHNWRHAATPCWMLDASLPGDNGEMSVVVGEDEVKMVLTRDRGTPGRRGDYFTLWGPWGSPRLEVRLNEAMYGESLYRNGVVIEVPSAITDLLKRIKRAAEDAFASAPKSRPGMTPTVKVVSEPVSFSPMSGR
jgi:hypothetical protein